MEDGAGFIVTTWADQSAPCGQQGHQGDDEPDFDHRLCVHATQGVKRARRSSLGGPVSCDNPPMWEFVELLASAAFDAVVGWVHRILKARD